MAFVFLENIEALQAVKELLPGAQFSHLSIRQYLQSQRLDFYQAIVTDSNYYILVSSLPYLFPTFLLALNQDQFHLDSDAIKINFNSPKTPCFFFHQDYNPFSH